MLITGQISRQNDFAKQQHTPGAPNHHIDGATLRGRASGTRSSIRRSRGSIAIPRRIPTPSTERAPRDFSEASRERLAAALYDPTTGDIDGRGRTAFAGNIIPSDRISAIAQKINAFYPLPNGPGNSSNYFKDYVSTFDRNQYDVKVNWNRSPAHQLWGKIGVMDATVSSLQKLSFDGGGYAKTMTWVGTVGQNFIPSKSLVIDTTVGYSLLDQYGWGPDYGTNYGLELGVPGTNGPDIRQSGMPVWGNGMSAQGSTDSWNPYTRFDPSYTVSANITKLWGTHSLRLGAAIDRQAMNHWQPEFGGTGPRGRLIQRQPGRAARGQTPNFYNQYADFCWPHVQVQKAISGRTEHARGRHGCLRGPLAATRT